MVHNSFGDNDVVNTTLKEFHSSLPLPETCQTSNLSYHLLTALFDRRVVFSIHVETGLAIVLRHNVFLVGLTVEHFHQVTDPDAPVFH